MIRLENVTKSYSTEVVAVRDASFDVAKGEFVFLVGPSGSGKTSLLRAIAGFEPVSQGQVLVDGEVVSAPGIQQNPEQRQIGVVFQDYALFPHLNVGDNICFGLWRQSRLCQSRFTACGIKVAA